MRPQKLLLFALIALGASGRAQEESAISPSETPAAGAPFRFKSISFDGSLEVLSEQAQNEQDLNDTANDERSNTVTRTRFGANLEFTDVVRARVEFARAPQVGLTTFQQTEYGNGLPTNVNQELSLFHVHNAYIELNRIFGLDRVRVGRQYFGRPGDFIAYYGPVNDNRMLIRSLQGIHARKEFRGMELNLAATKVEDDDQIPTPGAVPPTDADDASELGDVQMAYGYLNTGRLWMGQDGGLELEAGVYGATDKNNSADGDSNTLNIYDARAKYAVSLGTDHRVTLFGEFTVNDGADRGAAFDPLGNLISSDTIRAYEGHSYVLKGAYDWRKTLQVNGILAVASGDKFPNDDKITAYRDFTSLGFPGSDFRYGHIYHGSANLGFTAGFDTEAIGDTGMRLAGGGIKWMPARWDGRATAGVDYFSAELDEEHTNDDKLLMRELDLSVHYVHSDMVSVTGFYAMLWPGPQLRNILAVTDISDKITMVGFKLNFQFGRPAQVASY